MNTAIQCCMLLPRRIRLPLVLFWLKEAPEQSRNRLDIDMMDRKRRRTALQAAVAVESLDAVELLLENGADTSSCRTLPWDIRKPYNMGKIIRLLVRYGLNSNFDQQGEVGAVLQCAIKTEDLDIVKLLLDRGADIDLINEYQITDTFCHRPPRGNAWLKYHKTPLAIALCGKNKDMVMLLLDRGASMKMALRTLYDAEKCDGPEGLEASSMELLVECGMDIDHPLETWKLLETNLEIRRYGYKYERVRSGTILQYAVLTNNLAFAKYLLSKGAKTNTRNRHRETPHHLAARLGFISIARPLLNAERGEKDTPITDKTRECIDANDAVGNTALHLAAGRGEEVIVKMLLHTGADVEARDDEGRSAIHRAISGRNQDMALMLIGKGVELNSRDKRGRLPLHNTHPCLVELALAREIAISCAQMLTEIRRFIFYCTITWTTMLLWQHAA